MLLFVLALPIFPGRLQPSIVGANELNYRVRDGNGWTLAAISTNYSVVRKRQRPCRAFILTDPSAKIKRKFSRPRYPSSPAGRPAYKRLQRKPYPFMEFTSMKATMKSGAPAKPALWGGDP